MESSGTPAKNAFRKQLIEIITVVPPETIILDKRIVIENELTKIEPKRELHPRALASK